MKRGFGRSAALAALLCAAGAAGAAAQIRVAQPTYGTFISAWAGGYYDVAAVRDDSDTWDFGTSFAFGAGLHRQVGASLMLGIDASFSPADYEIRTAVPDTLAGSGQLVTLFASGRLRYGGGAELTIYLTGGAGAFMYRLSDHDTSDTDLGLLTGAGLQYSVTPRVPLFVEWGRYWVFHQDEGVEENTARHSHLRVGVRWGL